MVSVCMLIAVAACPPMMVSVCMLVAVATCPPMMMSVCMLAAVTILHMIMVMRGCTPGGTVLMGVAVCITLNDFGRQNFYPRCCNVPRAFGHTLALYIPLSPDRRN